MHPARLSYLSRRHEQQRKIVAQDVQSNGTRLTLECGHKVTIAPHFDTTKSTHMGCSDCGEQYVRTATQYAKEFINSTTPCKHETVHTPDGHGAYCKHCGETLV
jgi:hypothetical protein